MGPQPSDRREQKISLLRRRARVPLILSVDLFSVETEESASSVPGSRSLWYDILEHGLRNAVEYLSVDLDQDRGIISRIIRNRGTTKVIGHHIFDQSFGVTWEDEACFSLYPEAEKLGCQLCPTACPQ